MQLREVDCCNLIKHAVEMMRGKAAERKANRALKMGAAQKVVNAAAAAHNWNAIVHKRCGSMWSYHQR